ncbi:MAG: DinB family protein [Acidobacteriia bacterium]|nr:DinB family protein [Terriglobia bacterium]
MDSESLRIVDQLRRAFTGDAWHGPSVRESLDGIAAEQAHHRALPEAHTVWEMVLHMNSWVSVAFESIRGAPMPQLDAWPEDWPAVEDTSEPAWAAAKQHLHQSGERLTEAIQEFADANLQNVVPGRTYDFYFLFHGIVQHSLYHAGQIVLLKRAISSQS